MSMILGYIKEREISFLFFLLLILLVIVLWNLYKKEKKREEAAELSVAGERKYYVVCIPSSRQLKKYKIFVLPGWISGNIFMPPIVAFHEIPLVLRLQVLSVAGRLYSNLYIL